MTQTARGYWLAALYVRRPTEARNAMVGSDGKATSSITVEANRPLRADLDAPAA
jgi:hypothetical protein